jgi:hypothetical protein
MAALHVRGRSSLQQSYFADADKQKHGHDVGVLGHFLRRFLFFGDQKLALTNPPFNDDNKAGCAFRLTCPFVLRNLGCYDTAGRIGPMAKVHYCWRCRMEIPMLEEQEWKEMWPHLQGGARDGWQGARALYKKFTGLDEANPVAIAHHRLSYFGPPCESCGRL